MLAAFDAMIGNAYPVHILVQCHRSPDPTQRLQCLSKTPFMLCHPLKSYNFHFRFVLAPLTRTQQPVEPSSPKPRRRPLPFSSA